MTEVLRIDDDEKRIQFGMIMSGDRRVLLAGITAGVWEELKTGRGLDIDLSTMGINLGLVFFGAADKATAQQFIMQAGNSMELKSGEQTEPADRTASSHDDSPAE